MSNTKENPYPKSWYVCRKTEGLATALADYLPIPESVGNKSYALGYLNALCSFYPSPEYRLVDNTGAHYETRAAKSKAKLNTN